MNRRTYTDRGLRRVLTLGALWLAGVAAAGVPAFAQRLRDFTAPRPLPPDACLVIGFTGGIEHWNNAERPVRQLALGLRARALPHLFVETAEHRHRKRVLELIRKGLDRNRDGVLGRGERASACLILYGHSLGGMAVLKLARELQTLGVPVRLAIELDSIGNGRRSVPANVARVANFYQRSGPLLRGHADLELENPAATRIVANEQFHYSERHVDLSQVNPLERAAGGAHTKMEFDPEVWLRVEQLIVEEIKRVQ